MDLTYHFLTGALISKAATGEVTSGIVITAMLPDLIGTSFNYIFKFTGALKENNKELIKTYKHKLLAQTFANEFDKFAYRFTHSIIGIITFSLLFYMFWRQGPWYLLSLGYISHVAVDVPTHSKGWATRLFYPFSDYHIDGKDWWVDKKRYIFMWLILLIAWAIVLSI